MVVIPINQTRRHALDVFIIDDTSLLQLLPCMILILLLSLYTGHFRIRQQQQTRKSLLKRSSAAIGWQKSTCFRDIFQTSHICYIPTKETTGNSNLSLPFWCCYSHPKLSISSNSGTSGPKVSIVGAMYVYRFPIATGSLLYTVVPYQKQQTNKQTNNKQIPLNKENLLPFATGVKSMLCRTLKVLTAKRAPPLSLYLMQPRD